MVNANKQKCSAIYVLTFERILEFKKRMLEKDASPKETVIVAVNVNDLHGQYLAEALMPEENWQEIREHSKTLFARGITSRKMIQDALQLFDEEAAKKLQGSPDTVAVVVVDYGVAEVFFPDLGEIPIMYN